MRTRLQLRKTYCYDFVNNLIARDHSHEGKAAQKLLNPSGNANFRSFYLKPSLTLGLHVSVFVLHNIFFTVWTTLRPAYWNCTWLFHTHQFFFPDFDTILKFPSTSSMQSLLGDNLPDKETPGSDQGSNGPVDDQKNRGTKGMNARVSWTREVNKFVMECYLRSKPSRRGYRKRMLNNWRNYIGLFECSEQRLANQVRAS